MSQNGNIKRILRIEEEIFSPDSPETEDIYTIGDLAGDILELIDIGHICDWSQNDQSRDFDYSSLTNPTIADNLDEDERSFAYGKLHNAESLVAKFAELTGWRSPLGLADHREWLHWRANSAEELASVMRAILYAA